MENVDTQRGGSGAGALEGTVLAGRYRLAQVVSSGANTVIMDAIDLENDGQVTLKVVRPEHAHDPVFRRKFRRLAEVSAALTHPNIASVTDWGEIELGGESTVFWTVDALGGGSLRDLLDRGRLLEPGQALVLGLEACRALDAAHHKGLFHTELTPSKMVFGVDRRLRVVDFGMARLLAEPAWADAATVPTHVARYASPEQALGLPIDAKTDVYALALVMIEAVTGAVPFAADSTVATLAGRVDKLLPVSADLGSLASVLERAGRPESPDRFTAAEFGRALVQAAPKLSKPKPMPILVSGTFDTTAMRRPTDPTGGVERPAPVAGLAGVDEAGVARAAAAASVAGGAAVAGAAVASSATTNVAAPDAAAAGATTAGGQRRVDPPDEPAVADAVGVEEAVVDAVVEAAVVEEVVSDEPRESAAAQPAAPRPDVAGSGGSGGPEGVAVAGDPATDEPFDDESSTAAEAAVVGAVAAGAGAVVAGTAGATAADIPTSPTDVDAPERPDDADDTDEPDDSGEPVDSTDPDDQPAADPLADDADADVDAAEPDADLDLATAVILDPDAVVDPGTGTVDSSDARDETDVESNSEADVAASVASDAAIMPLEADASGTPATAADPVVSDTGATAVIPVTEAPPVGGVVFDDEPTKRRRGPIIVTVLLLIVGLAALGYAGSLLLQTKSFAVPVLAGVPEDEALNQVAGNGWELETLRERSDSFPEPDTVIRTVPGAGVELDEGAPFTLVLSDGPEFRTLPELGELPFDAALAELAGLGLIGVEGPEREFSETIPPDSVIAWQVEGDADGGLQAGGQILPGETIVMTLSQGPEPRTVPSLDGLTGPEGRVVIEDLQLVFERNDDVFSDTVEAGLIVSQTPAADASLDRGGTVTVVVSKGPDVVEFPDLEGLVFAEAQELLVSTGLTIGTLLGTTEGTFVEATIDGADVPVGEVLRRGTAIDLIFL